MTSWADALHVRDISTYVPVAAPIKVYGFALVPFRVELRFISSFGTDAVLRLVL